MRSAKCSKRTSTFTLDKTEEPEGQRAARGTASETSNFGKTQTETATSTATTAASAPSRNPQPEHPKSRRLNHRKQNIASLAALRIELTTNICPRDITSKTNRNALISAKLTTVATTTSTAEIGETSSVSCFTPPRNNWQRQHTVETELLPQPTDSAVAFASQRRKPRRKHQRVKNI